MVCPDGLFHQVSRFHGPKDAVSNYTNSRIWERKEYSYYKTADTQLRYLKTHARKNPTSRTALVLNRLLPGWQQPETDAENTGGAAPAVMR